MRGRSGRQGRHQPANAVAVSPGFQDRCGLWLAGHAEAAAADTKAPAANGIPPYYQLPGLHLIRLARNGLGVFPFPVCRCTRGRGCRCCFLIEYFPCLFGQAAALLVLCERDAKLYTRTVTDTMPFFIYAVLAAICLHKRLYFATTLACECRRQYITCMFGLTIKSAKA